MDATPWRRNCHIAKCTTAQKPNPIDRTWARCPNPAKGAKLRSDGAGSDLRDKTRAYVGAGKPSYLHQMKSNSPIRTAMREVLIPSTVLATLCCGISVSYAQSTKPSAAVAVSTPSGLANSPNKPQLNVDFVAGKLTVTATNASLNQILHEVSRSIGMKITGGVVDERVFGQYGPSVPSVVLAALLDGTGSNMLLVDNAKGPTELILTPRTGGATPPSPSAPRPEAEEQPEPPQPPPAVEGQRFPPRRGIGRPPTPNAPADANPDDSSNGSDGAPSPNGNKTPQQIYNELRQMQQQQTTQAPQ
jgi:hypothetical protein